MKKTLILLVVAMFWSTAAFAFQLYTGTADNPGTTFEDDMLQYFTDNDGDGLITAGDVINVALDFSKVWDNTGGSAVYNLDQSADELVGWATLTIGQTKSIDLGAGPFIYAWNIPSALVEVYSGGSMDLLTNQQPYPTSTYAQNAVKDGIHLWDFAITNNPATFWTVAADLSSSYAAYGQDPALAATLANSISFGTANFQLDQVWGDDIWDPVNVAGGTADLFGSAQIKGGLNLGYDPNDPSTYAFSSGDVDVTGNPVPEPSTLLLLGAGLLGLGYCGRRRK